MNKELTPLQQSLNTIIFGTNTPAGKAFDVFLILIISFSVLLVAMDTVSMVSKPYQHYFVMAEWLFTILFTIEYGTRLYCSSNPREYARSFYGIIDLLSILPTYLALIFPGSQYLLVIRLVRVLRVFRVLKLVRYLGEAHILMRSMIAARRKILLFFCSVAVLITIFGSMMYVIEGPSNGFTSIPQSIYWAIVTITTVGYGDIVPQTITGQFIASLVMLTGYSILAVPTGIISAELSQEMTRERQLTLCSNCSRGNHDADARFCKY